MHDLQRDQEIAQFDGAQTLLSEMPESGETSEKLDNGESFVVDLLLLADARINRKVGKDEEFYD